MVIKGPQCMGARMGEGKNRRSPPPLWKIPFFIAIWGPNYCYLFPQLEAFLLRFYSLCRVSGACPGIRMGITYSNMGVAKSESLFFFFFFAFQFLRGDPAQKIAEKMIFSTKKVAKY